MTIFSKAKLYLFTAALMLSVAGHAYAVENDQVPNLPPVEAQREAAAVVVVPDVTPEIVTITPAAPVIQATVLDMPAITAQSNDPAMADYPILRVTQDKSEMVKLEMEAASVIVGNPNHISVLLDTPDTLVVVPRAPGASHFTVMGKDGSVIMQRHVIVGAAKEQYVRIRRSCGADDRNCQPTSTYFCPDMCHEVQENTQSQTRRR